LIRFVKLSLVIVKKEEIIIPELFSRPLSPEAKAKLIDFIQAYIETLIIAEVDEKAEIAKKKAIEVLNTDIDILVFATTIMALYQADPFINQVKQGVMTSRQVAELVVEISEEARKEDKAFRMKRG